MTQSRDLWTPHIGRNPGDIDTSVGESESYLEVHNCVIELWGNAVLKRVTFRDSLRDQRFSLSLEFLPYIYPVKIL